MGKGGKGLVRQSEAREDEQKGRQGDGVRESWARFVWIDGKDGGDVATQRAGRCVELR
jgi:hypothetical protein